MKNFEDYKKYGLNYIDDEIKIIEGNGFIKSGRVKILDCGCVYVDNNLEEVCNLHKNLEYEKLKKINEIKNATREIILNKYSEKQQLNILTGVIGTGTEKTTCKNFISDKIMQGQNFQDKINSITTIEELNNFKYEFIEE